MEKKIYNYNILHLINNDHPNRGGAQKILQLLLNPKVGTLTLDDDFLINKFFTLFFQFFKIFKRCFSFRPQCVFIHSRCYLPFAMIFKLFSINVVFYAHAHYRKHSWLFRLFSCNYYISVSEAVKSSLIKQGIKSKNIRVVYNPYIGEKIYYGTNEQSNNNYFSSIGSLNLWKGFHEAVIFLNKIKTTNNVPIEYSIVGEGNERRSLTSLSDKLTNVNLTLKGFQSSPFSALVDVPFILIPSLEEGFGLVAIEAIYQNKIIIYSDVPALLEICINDPLSFSFDIHSFDSFEKAVNEAQKIYKNTMISSYAQKRQSYILSTFSTDLFYQNHSEILHGFGLKESYFKL